MDTEKPTKPLTPYKMPILRAIETIKLPLSLIQDEGEGFLLSCKHLSIYIKAKTEADAKKDFEQAVGLLFQRLSKTNTLMRFLSQRNLIHSDTTIIADLSKGNKPPNITLDYLYDRKTV